MSERPNKRLLGRKLRAALTRDWGLKLISVLLAIVLWIVVITQDDAARIRAVMDIPVQIIGEEELAERGLAVKQDLHALIRVADVDVRATQSERQKLDTRGVVTAVIDLGAVTEAGTQGLQIRAGSSFGIADRSYPDEITVDIEPLKTAQIPVIVRAQGVLPEGFRQVGDFETSPRVIEISGAQSDVERIRSARVDVDLSGQTEPFVFADEIQFIDDTNQAVDAENLDVQATSVTVSGDVYPKATKAISYDIASAIVGTPAEGYVVRGIELAWQESVEIAAPQEVLDSIPSLTFEPINVEGKSEPITQEALLERPAGVQWMESETTRVVVSIAEVEDTRTFAVPLVARNQRPGTRTDFDEGTEITVDITAVRSLISALTREDVVAYIDLATFGEGEWSVPVEVEVPWGEPQFYQVAPIAIHVTIEPAS